MNELKDQMDHLKEQLGNEKQGMIHDAVMTAQAEAQRVREEAQRRREEAQRVRDQAQRIRDEARRVRDEARRAAGNITVMQDQDGGLKTTKIDIGKAQIVYSDDKGELRVEKVDGKKVLTAKDPQGLLLFSGPVETKEELDKVPAEVRQRYEKLQQNDLPAVISAHGSDVDVDVHNYSDDESDNGCEIQSLNHISNDSLGRAGNVARIQLYISRQIVSAE